MVAGKQVGSPMPSLAESDWPGSKLVGRWWRRDLRMKRNQFPDAQIQVFGLSVGDSGSSTYQHRIRSFNSWCNV